MRLMNSCSLQIATAAQNPASFRIVTASQKLTLHIKVLLTASHFCWVAALCFQMLTADGELSAVPTATQNKNKKVEMQLVYKGHI